MTGSVIGIDMGIKDFAVSSDGIAYETINTSQRAKRNLPNCNGSSPKAKGSRNRDGAHVCRLLDCMSIFQTSAKICSMFSSQLIRENDVICIEDLAPKNMVKNHKLCQVHTGRELERVPADSLNIKQSGMARRSL